MYNRIIGTETEFGLYVYGRALSPRGFDEINLRKLTCIDNLEMDDMCGNMSGGFLYNGGRLYKESISRDENYTGCFTPEFATPECRTVKDAVCWEKAGETIMTLLFPESLKGKVAKHGYGMGAVVKDLVVSGHHENYSLLMNKDVAQNLYYRPLLVPTRQLLTFLASRVIISGSGWINLLSKPFGYEISFRTSILEKDVSSHTTSIRGMICDGRTGEPLSSEMVRMHLILGDHNMSEMSIYLTLGTTSLMLWMIEEHFLREDAPRVLEPLEAIHVFSKDITLEHRVRLENEMPSGAKLASALDLQEYFCSKAKEFVRINLANSEYRDIVDYWSEVVHKLRREPSSLKWELDWITKRHILSEYLKRRGININEVQLNTLPEEIVNKCTSLDLAYHFVDKDGLYNRLVKAGKIKRLLTDENIQNSVYNAPQDTRANVRSDFLKFLAATGLKGSLSISWDKLYINTGWPYGKAEVSLSNPFDSHSESWEDVKKLYNDNRRT